MKSLNLAALGLALAAGTAFANEPATKPAGADTARKPATVTRSAPDSVRDWSKIDLNKDNLISPEEMEKYLAENPGPLRK